MPNALQDGERRTMRPPLGRAMSSTEKFEVIAYREDSETPYVILKDHETGKEYYLTDSGAENLAQRIYNALSVLPTSK